MWPNYSNCINNGNTEANGGVWRWNDRMRKLSKAERQLRISARHPTEKENNTLPQLVTIKAMEFTGRIVSKWGPGILFKLGQSFWGPTSSSSCSDHNIFPQEIRDMRLSLSKTISSSLLCHRVHCYCLLSLLSHWNELIPDCATRGLRN